MGSWWPEVKLLLMKNSARNYGRNFCGNIESACIVKSALAGFAKYRLLDCIVKIAVLKNSGITDAPAARIRR